jgi:hypothetical protein
MSRDLLIFLDVFAFSVNNGKVVYFFQSVWFLVNFRTFYFTYESGTVLLLPSNWRNF